MKKYVWTMKGGKKCMVYDMTDKHLENTIGYLEKKQNEDYTDDRQKWIRIMTKELGVRAHERELDNVLSLND